MEIVTLSDLPQDKLQELIGKRVILGGKGILDGLKHKSRASSDRVLGLTIHPYYGKCIRMISYGKKTTVLLPECNWDQQAAILTEKEYKELPKW